MKIYLKTEQFQDTDDRFQKLFNKWVISKVIQKYN